jgi:hypothetical protein
MVMTVPVIFCFGETGILILIYVFWTDRQGLLFFSVIVDEHIETGHV